MLIHKRKFTRDGRLKFVISFNEKEIDAAMLNFAAVLEYHDNADARDYPPGDCTCCNYPADENTPKEGDAYYNGDPDYSE